MSTTIKSYTDTVESSQDNIESKIGTVKTTTTATSSKADTIKASTDTLESSQDNIESKVGTVKTTTTTVDSKADTLKTTTTTISSKVDTVKSYTDTIESSQDNIESKIDSMKGGSFSGTDSLTDIKAAVDAIQNNTDFTASVVPEMEIPAAGSNDYGISVNVYDGAGAMEDPDLDTVLAKAVNPAGTSRNANLYEDAAQTTALTKVSIHTVTDPTVDPTAGATYTDTNATVLTCIGMVGTTTFMASWTGVTAPVTGVLTKTGGVGDATLTSSAVDNDYVSLERLSAGRFEAFYNVESGDAEENLRFTFTYYEAAARRFYDRSSNVVDKISTATLDTIDSKCDTIKSYTDTLESSQDNIESKVNTSNSRLATVKTSTDTIESSQDNIESKIGTVKTSTDTIESSQDNIESKIGTVQTSVGTSLDSKLDTVKASTDTIESSQDNVESKLNTVKTSTDTVESAQDTIKSLVTTVKTSTDTIESSQDNIESKVTTIKTASIDNFSQFEEVVFPKTTGTIAVDGNDTEEIATTASQQTAYNDTAIMASRVIGQGDRKSVV